MQTIINKSSIKIILALTLSLFIFLHCEDSNDPIPDAPVMPPQSAVSLDLSSLTNSGTPKISLAKVSDNSSTMVGTNWVYAAGTVGFWTSVTSISLSIPAAAFAGTINQEPEYLGDLRWKWTKTFQILLAQYTAELYGEINGSKVDWEMYISQTGGYSDYLWFTGESNLDGSGGTWTFNKSAAEPVEYLQIEWNLHSDEIDDLRYEVIQTGAENEGSYIFYAFDNDEVYNSACTLFNSVDTILVNVEWHRINRNGRVKSPAYFEDNLWHCWDENRDNLECN